MAKYMQDSTDIQINEVSGTDNINFSFKNGNSLQQEINNINTKIGNLDNLETPTTNNLVGAINSIVESGSNDYGNYIKFADGTMICTREIAIDSVTLSTTWGSWYIYENTTAYNFPQTFISIPHIQLSFIATSPAGACLGNYGDCVLTTSSYKGFMLFRPTTQTVTGKLFIEAIGRWKQ